MLPLETFVCVFLLNLTCCLEIYLFTNIEKNCVCIYMSFSLWSLTLSVLQTFFLLHKSFKCITPEIARKPCRLDFDIHDTYDTAQNLQLSNTPLSFNNGCEEYLVCFFIRSHQKDKSKPKKRRNTFCFLC